MYLTPLMPYPEAAGPADGRLGLSFVHISSPAGAALDGAMVGESLVGPGGRATLKPVNGWGAVEAFKGVPKPPGYDVEPGAPDTVGVFRRGVGMVSVGFCPVREAEAKRGTVTRLTEQSKSRMTAALQDLLPSYRFMGTLTVGREWSRDGAWFKGALDKFFVWFLRAMRKQSGNPTEDSIFWFLEFQARGAPHVHFFYTTRVPWLESAEKWAKICDDPMMERIATRFEKLRGVNGGSPRGGALAYARKYARKLAQKLVPEDYRSVGRFWGVRGCRIRCTCKVQMPATKGGVAYVRRVMDYCEASVDQGYLRRLVWQFGEGVVYFVPQRFGTLYDIPGPAGYRSLGAALDMLTAREVLENA